MLVPVRGPIGALNLSKRNRQMPTMRASLATVEVPSVYVFNIWTRVWKEGRFIIPACPPGEQYSEPLVIDGLVLAEFDLADGGGNMGVTVDPGMEVARDLVGTTSSSPSLDLYSTNKEWFGVFATVNEIPTREELRTAREKLTQMMELVYAKGSELVQAGEKVHMLDRKNYNDAAAFLGRQPLWGSQEHTLDECPLCHEAIRAGAVFCKHCHQAIDAKSLAKRESAMYEDEVTDDVEAQPETPAKPTRGRKSKAAAPDLPEAS